MKICLKRPNLVEIEEKYRTLYTKTKYGLLSSMILNRHKSAVYE